MATQHLHTSDSSGRDCNIDFLRAFGLLCLVIAHTSPPEWLGELRTFDVPLMVFVSALCFRPVDGGYAAYFKKRFLRIYRPVCLFLTIFFIVFGIGHIFCGLVFFKFKYILGSYLLLNQPSIGYVWIMRVFLFIALIATLLYGWFDKISCRRYVVFAMVILAVQYLFTLLLGLFTAHLPRDIISQTLPYFTGYALFFVLGLNIRSYSRTTTFLLILLAGVATLLLSQHLGFHLIDFKYPPQSIYLTYGIFGIVVLWMLLPYIPNCVKTNKAVLYLSRNSMWLYLWHIVPIYLMESFGWPAIFGIRFAAVLTGALLLTGAYQWIVKRYFPRIASW